MIKPLPGYVLVEPIEEDTKTAGGLYVPEEEKDKPAKGKVVDGGWYAVVNPGTTMEWQWSLKDMVGKIVIYKRYTNQEVKDEGKKYLLISFNELLAVYE